MSTNATFLGLSLYGGSPTRSEDLAPSIIFEFLYALLIPLAILRFLRPANRCGALVRPAIFVVVRLGTFIVRAAQANGARGWRWSVAEQVFLTSGTVFVLDPILNFVTFHVMRHTPPSAERSGRRPVTVRLFELALLAAFILGIYASTKYGHLSDPDTVSTLSTCRNVNAIICLVVAAGSGLVVLVCHWNDRALPVRTTILLTIISLFLSSASAFRLYVYYAHPPPASTGGGIKAAFWVFAITAEWIATVLYFATPIVEWTDAKGDASRRRESKEMRKAQKAGQESKDEEWDVGMAKKGAEKLERPPPTYQRGEQQV